ncbi:MAG: SpoIIE family protein phosphatase [Spirochaetota bacterium]
MEDNFKNILKNSKILPGTPRTDNPFSFSKNPETETKPTILIIDDDALVRESLSITLGKKFNVVLCANGNEGIAKTGPGVFAVILDIKMEGKNGFETFKEIKKKDIYLPIIFYSAYQDIKSPMEIINNYSPFGYVIKGGAGNELLHTIESAVDYYFQINQNALLVNTVKAQEKQHRTLLNNLNVGVFRLKGSKDCLFIECNPTLTDILGFSSSEELNSHSLLDFFKNAQDRERFIKSIEKLGNCKNFQVEFVKKNKNTIWVSINATVIRNELGEVNWIDGVLDDTTMIKDSNEKLQLLMLDINDLNANLEQKIADRTKELDQSLKLIKNDLMVAKKIQENTLYTNFSMIEDLLIEIKYLPISEVGGDFYNISKINNITYRIFIADATGHGVQAALITMAIKGIYDSLKHVIMNVETLLEIFNNEFIIRYESLKSLLTAFVIDIDTQNHTIKYTSAGHPAGVLLQDSKLKLLTKTGRMVGVLKDTPYKSFQCSFSPGDRLFLFTDGIFEVFNDKNEEFGEERLHSILLDNGKKSLEDTIKTSFAELQSFQDGSSRADDLTILGIEYK